MEEVIVLVNGFTGPCYGEGIIVFHYNSGVVAHGKSGKKSYIYHTDNEDIKELEQRHPDIIQSYKKKMFTSLTEWGYQTEQALCTLMQEERLFFDREVDGQQLRVHYIWEGPEWNPSNRPTKRN